MIKLDYLLGRQVVKVEKHGQSWNWTIRLDGHTKIKNRDHALATVPSNEIVGTTFLGVTDDGKIATLSFGNVFPESSLGPARNEVVAEILMTVGKMTVAAPGEDEHDPYATDNPVEDVPPDPSSLRVASGPVAPQKPKKASGKAQKAKK